jgi:hypothetical protein
MSKKFKYSPCYCYPTTTCPLLEKIQAIVAGEKQKHQQDEEDEVKILYLDSRCTARAALLKQYSERKESRKHRQEKSMVLRNNLLGTENGVMRCDVEEIVTVIAQREDRFKRR